MHQCVITQETLDSPAKIIPSKNLSVFGSLSTKQSLKPEFSGNPYHENANDDSIWSIQTNDSTEFEQNRTIAASPTQASRHATYGFDHVTFDESRRGTEREIIPPRKDTPYSKVMPRRVKSDEFQN